ncbi:MAG: arginine--tRNA ligase [Deltaproteobacteria bacterium]|nr:arginine--tRNA ligase [Candidatus Anaeroferrophillacea bacterium]
MRNLIRTCLEEAVGHLAADVAADILPEVVVEPPRDRQFGDFASNIAMQLARVLKRNPRDIAVELAAMLGEREDIAAVDVAGPGFINITLPPSAWTGQLRRIFQRGTRWGEDEGGRGRRVMVEFVSANPTGPLHIGHGRGAAVGDSLVRILRKAGYTVISEYYINDAGNQMETLGRSLQRRYLELAGEINESYPETYYQGEYLVDLARRLREERGTELVDPTDPDASLPLFTEYAGRLILDGISDDLAAFGIRFDNWTSEKQLFEDGRVDRLIAELRERGQLYEQDGALWFPASRMGDEKDRVVVRSNGVKTYFASDIAYHRDKDERGFDVMVDVWGADHHGYVPRLAAALQAVGIDSARFVVILVQLVSLMRGEQPVAMSTRAGQFVTLREVIDEVGKDAARFFFLMRRPDSHLDFDLELAKSQSNENPVYYVQYAHARICSILRTAAEKGVAIPQTAAFDLSSLHLEEELELIRKLDAFPVVVETAAAVFEPHRVSYYVSELAALFHSYYNRHRVVSEDGAVTAARLVLVQAVRNILQSGLELLGVDAPESM